MQEMRENIYVSGACTSMNSLLLYLKPADREKENRAGGVSAVTDDGWVRRNLFTAPVQNNKGRTKCAGP